MSGLREDCKEPYSQQVGYIISLALRGLGRLPRLFSGVASVRTLVAAGVLARARLPAPLRGERLRPLPAFHGTLVTRRICCNMCLKQMKHLEHTFTTYFLRPEKNTIMDPCQSK